ncbi:MAG: molecular chaperone GrpE [Candidatus Petromonas sp.]|jgi:molecular chaperone GrpE|nr:molecular chaperone GrpE [Candidatus Petromonas sp.]
MDNVKKTKEFNLEKENEATKGDVDSNLEAIQEELVEETNEENCERQSEPLENEEEINKYIKEIEEYKDKYLRLSADFQNYKKRVEREKKEIYNYGSEKVILDILPILDNLERAIHSAENDGGENNNLKSGIEMVYKQFMDALKKHGVEVIECVGKEFDPNRHHAVMQEESQESDSNIVIEEFQRGYMLNSKVIRPSMVKVAK